MNELQKAFGEGIVLLFIGVMLVPIIKTPILYFSSQAITKGISFALVSETIWTDRLSEIYLHALFLATTIIASVLALRKPPRFAPEELQKFGLTEQGNSLENTVVKQQTEVQ